MQELKTSWTTFLFCHLDTVYHSVLLEGARALAAKNMQRERFPLSSIHIQERDWSNYPTRRKLVIDVTSVKRLCAVEFMLWNMQINKIAVSIVRIQGAEDPCTSQETPTQKCHWNRNQKSGLDKRRWWCKWWWRIHRYSTRVYFHVIGADMCYIDLLFLDTWNFIR